MTASPSIDWPTGGFDWTDELRAKLPVVRGTHAPEFKAKRDSPGPMPDFSCRYPDSVSNLQKLLAREGLALDPTPWTDAEARSKVTEETLRNPNLAFWRELICQCAARFDRGDKSAAHLFWAMKMAYALYPLAFVLRVILDLGPAQTRFLCFQPAHCWLRHALAVVPDDEHRAAREVVEGFRGRGADFDALICYLFPEISEWAEACLETHGIPARTGYSAYASWASQRLLSTALSMASAARLIGPEPNHCTRAILLQIRLHGEAAWPLLEHLLDWASRRRKATQEVKLVCRMRTPALIPALIARLGQRDIRDGFNQLASKYPAAVLKITMDRAVASRSRTLEAWSARLAARRPKALAAVLAAATEAERQRYARALIFLAPPPEEASAESVPTALRNPLPPELESAPLPDFYLSAAFRRPRLRTGQALSLDAVERLGRWLAASTLESPRPELADIKAACTAESLAEFAWDVFKAWQVAGNSNKHWWGLTSLGLVGDGSSARRLIPHIREWRGRSLAMERAAFGVDAIAAIGNEAALMHLYGIAGNPAFKNLAIKAQARIDQIAEARGWTEEQLADRLVPDFGLDEQGRLELDYGPRQFRVGFDEALKPFVTNPEGKRLKDLPKPNGSDNALLAPLALARYRELKKDAKAVAALQIARLEWAMCLRRRWRLGEFQAVFLNHPLMRHLAQRLVWGVYLDGALQTAVRVAEDASLADAQDQLYAPPDGAEMGIAHALELPEGLAREFGQVFADYEIQQPFKQLGRETYALTDAERQTRVVKRFEERVVATGAIMGLLGRGWGWGERDRYVLVGSLSKGLGEGFYGDLGISPGIQPADPRIEPVQALGWLILCRDGGKDLTGLDPILASEILRDLDLLPIRKN